ncbi:AAA family ATPase [Actinophytocola oryzae]|uniref:Putative ATPase n=1 Tax=Actinophytocola oryzae TaxID=502181 RepID=A0A4R7VXM9_9PSEU|nr:AAA family ATPase [Actinophytocola oryzae]TDV53967.1 putative ATPase [Actinophytocola oryzae]
MIQTLAVENYRSLRRLVLPLSPLTVVTGANGAGKSSLYRALRLLGDASRDGVIAALAREGGLSSTLWAGPEQGARKGRPVQGTVRTRPVELRLGFGGDEYGYALDFGLPRRGETMFNPDPEFKREALWSGPVLRPATLLAERSGEVVRARGEDGAWGPQVRLRLTDSITWPRSARRSRACSRCLPSLRCSARSLRSRRLRCSLSPDTGGPLRLSELAEPEVLLLRDRMRSWRFYDQFRTDRDAPARQPTIGTRTPVLGHEGADLPAALQTIREVGAADDLDDAVSDAFPGARVQVVDHDGRFGLRFHQHGLLRPLDAAELSDGTLRYLLWVAALLTPRPPELLVLNEPETSLHPDLLPPLANLVMAAPARSQIVVVTHSAVLVGALTKASVLTLVKELSTTVVEGQGRLDQPSWHWPER